MFEAGLERLENARIPNAPGEDNNFPGGNRWEEERGMKDKREYLDRLRGLRMMPLESFVVVDDARLPRCQYADGIIPLKEKLEPWWETPHLYAVNLSRRLLCRGLKMNKQKEYIGRMDRLVNRHWILAKITKNVDAKLLMLRDTSICLDRA
ncbi:hypothetical protein KQX54_006004 [Cotesia glomerata]|uniref:Uncharacterized protein n=1 Tax=Cotesia glomerata TaxID=32391 RepID=A0AAV7I7I7_COTGL|nr:hypothetical protein KQX54_006004 [Cotesia glomerata]